MAGIPRTQTCHDSKNNKIQNTQTLDISDTTLLCLEGSVSAPTLSVVGSRKNTLDAFLYQSLNLKVLRVEQCCMTLISFGPPVGICTCYTLHHYIYSLVIYFVQLRLIINYLDAIIS